jgi:hypothetical protein
MMLARRCGGWRILGHSLGTSGGQGAAKGTGGVRWSVAGYRIGPVTSRAAMRALSAQP